MVLGLPLLLAFPGLSLGKHFADRARILPQNGGAPYFRLWPVSQILDKPSVQIFGLSFTDDKSYSKFVHTSLIFAS